MRKAMLSLFASVAVFSGVAGYVMTGQTAAVAQSVPIVPVQPDKEQYGVSDISLFKTYKTPEQYRAEFGVKPPAFNPAARPKTWFDSTVKLEDPEADVCYKIIRAVSGVPSIVQSCMPAWEAATVNIPPNDPLPVVSLQTDEQRARWRPAREVPVRDLLPGEAVAAGFGGIPVIVRLDRKQSQDERDGKFTASDRELLRAVARKLGLL